MSAPIESWRAGRIADRQQRHDADIAASTARHDERRRRFDVVQERLPALIAALSPDQRAEIDSLRALRAGGSK